MTEAPWLPYEEITEADLALLPDDGHRYEIVDGSLFVSPPASSTHQRGAHRLAALLNDAAPAGLEAMEGVGVRAGRSFLIPDVSVVRSATASKDVTSFEPADVRVVVEFVSPSSVTMDRLMKPALYAAAGIPAYWRVEREHPDGVLVAFHELDGPVYRLVTEVVGDAEAVITQPFDVRFRPAELIAPR